MMDAMDAVEFLDKVDRLSKRGSTEEKARYNDYRTARDNAGAVKFVERWAAEHPIKTRQSVFLEQYPEARLSKDGVLLICPRTISSAYRNEEGTCNIANHGTCADCRREFWLAEVEE